MTPKIINEADMDAATDALIRKNLCRCFPADIEIFKNTRSWHGSLAAWTALLCDADEIAAHVGIVDRLVKFDEVEMRIAGIQNVFVLPEYRGKGLSTKIMNIAMGEANKRNLDCGLLFCVPELEKVYAHSGWTSLGQLEIIRVDETGSERVIPQKNIGMCHPLKRNPGTVKKIHLQGNDW